MLSAHDFPPGTPLHHFFAWNAQRWRKDRRYLRMRHPERLPAALAAPLAVAVGNADVAAHAAVFTAFEAAVTQPGRILVIRLSALGDLVQSLGPMAAIREHHKGDRVALLTTRPFAGFAAELGWFDEVLVDERPRSPARWLGLRRRLRQARFDRVYDLQTSQRSSAYAWLLRPVMPQWSGIAWGCSHPHANLDRDRRHTLDKQAEQLLMAGIHPIPPPRLPPLARALPPALAGRAFVLLAPGSSPRHPAKRWPADRFGRLARALAARDYIAAVVGTVAEAPLATAIRDICPDAIDLTGATDLGLLAALAQHARLTVGNDSGVSHLAAASGCPLLVLFSRHTDPARHAPRGSCVRVLASPDLAELAADEVIAEAIELLDRAYPRAGRGTG